MPRPREEPKVAVFVAVTNYKEFRDNALTDDEKKALKTEDGVESTIVSGQTIFFLDRKTVAVVTNSKETAVQLARKPAGLDTKISKELGGKLQASDLGVYLSMDVFNKDYAEQIKEAHKTIDDLIKTGLDQVGKEQRAGLEMIQKAIGPIFQAVEDSQGLLLSVELRETGLNLHMQSELRAGTPSSKALQEAKVSAFKDLGHLPEGQMFYTGMQASPALIKAMGTVLFGVINEPDAEAAKKVQAAVAELVKAGPSTRLDSAAIPVQSLQVWTYNNPAEAVDATLQLVQALAAGSMFQSAQLKEKPVIKKNAEKHGDLTFHSIKLTWDLDKMLGASAGQLPEEAQKKMKESLKTMLGDGLTIWLGTDRKHLLQIAAKDWATAEKLLGSYLKNQDGVSEKGNFKEVRKELPAEATVLLVIDLVKYAAAVLQYAKPLLENQFPLPRNFPAAPPKGKVSFVGAAVALQPDRGGFDFYVSTAAMKDVYEAFVVPFLGR